MKTFNRSDVFSWRNTEEAKAYLGKDCYFAHSVGGLSEHIKTGVMGILKDIFNSNYDAVSCAFGDGTSTWGLCLPADKVIDEALGWREDRQSITYQLDPGAYKPTKAHPSDAGYDLYARMDVELVAGSTVRVDTGVHVLIPDGYVGLVQPCSSYSDAGVLAAGSTVRVDIGAHGLIPDGYVGLVLPRSSFNCAAGVGTATGVIDAGYTGSISVVLSSKSDLKIYAGSRIAQLVIVPLPEIRLVEGDVMAHKSERGCGGFGSSGR